MDDPARTLPTEKGLSRRKPRFWQELFLYVWIFSLLGTWYELLLSVVLFGLTGDRGWWRPTDPWLLFQFAEPYGLGAAAVILLVIPARRRFHWGPLPVFLLSAALTGAIEALSGQVLVLALGSNPFWDYSRYPYGLDGLSSPASCAVFGVVGVLFVYAIHPWSERALRRVSDRVIASASWLALALYLLALGWKLVALGWLHWPPGS